MSSCIYFYAAQQGGAGNRMDNGDGWARSQKEMNGGPPRDGRIVKGGK